MMAEVEVPVGAMMKAQHDERDLVLSGVFRDCYPMLVGLAGLLLDERGQAEEVVQEAFARTYMAWPRLRDQSDPLPYLRRTVVNLARGGLRRRVIARRYQPAPLSESPPVESGLLADEQRTEVAKAIAALPRRQRECIVLRYFADCTTAETATVLGISDGSVKQHVHRAMDALAKVLGDDTEAES